jgi:tetratricopeptide (TPR) repeat protein
MTSHLEDARRLIQRRSFGEGLGLVQYDPTFAGRVLAARCFLELERFAEARHRLNMQWDARDALALAEASYCWGRVLPLTTGILEDGIESFEHALAICKRAALPQLGAEAAAELAIAYATKQARGVAEDALERGRVVAGDLPRLAVARADLLLMFDDRTAAKEQFALAATQGEVRLGELGVARTATLLGDYESAEVALSRVAALEHSDRDLLYLRTSCFLARSRGDWTQAATFLERIHDASPESDRAESDRIERAGLLLKAERVEEAASEYQALASSERPDIAQAAQRMSDLLHRSGGSTKRVTLQAFPTIAQERNTCGPSACALYLRFYGLEADADAIAKEIKFKDGGTPVYRIRAYLERAGLSTRRVEANLDLLKRLLDAGIPAILEEEYSASTHVAVAIGYDDRRGVLEVQDPMTHEVRETAYESLGKLRDLFNDGILVGVPREQQHVLHDVIERDTDYIAATDRAAEALDEDRLEDADRLVNEALQLRADYEIAHLVRFSLAMRRMRASRSTQTLEACLTLAREARATWPEAEWPCQLEATALYEVGRLEDAMAAAIVAVERDGADARNHFRMALCKLALGAHESAGEPLRRTLECDPAHAEATSIYAEICRRERRALLARMLNLIALERLPEGAFSHAVYARLERDARNFDSAAASFVRAAQCSPDVPGYLAEAAQSLAAAGRQKEAIDVAERAVREHPNDFESQVEVASLYYHMDRFADAESAARRAIDLKTTASGVALLGASLAAQGRLEEGLIDLERATLLAPTYDWAFAERGKHLWRAGYASEAAQSYAIANGLRPGIYQAQMGLCLGDAGHYEEALKHLEPLALNGDLDEEALWRAGELAFLSDPTEGQRLRGFFEKLVKIRPDDPDVLAARIRALSDFLSVEPDPTDLARVAPEHAVIQALQSVRSLLGNTALVAEDAEARAAEAIASRPNFLSLRAAYAKWLNQRGRASQALESVFPHSLPYSLVTEARCAALSATNRVEACAKERVTCDELYDSAGLAQTIFSYRVEMMHGRYRKAMKLCREEFPPEPDPNVASYQVEYMFFVAALCAFDADRIERTAIALSRGPGSLPFYAATAGAMARTDIAERLLARVDGGAWRSPMARLARFNIAEAHEDVAAALALPKLGLRSYRAKAFLALGDLRAVEREVKKKRPQDDVELIVAELRFLQGRADESLEILLKAKSTRDAFQFPHREELEARGMLQLVLGKRAEAQALFTQLLNHRFGCPRFESARIERLLNANVPAAQIRAWPEIKLPSMRVHPAKAREIKTCGLVDVPTRGRPSPAVAAYSAAQRWAASLSAPMAGIGDRALADLELDTQGAGTSIWGRHHGGANLSKQWGLHTREDVRAQLEKMLDVGESQPTFLRLTRAMDGVEQSPTLPLQGWTYLREHREEFTHGLLAYDMGRLVMIAGWAWNGGLLSEEEAWHYIFDAARRLQAAYSSWKEYARQYVLGRELVFGPNAVTGKNVERLLTEAESPWAQLPWSTPLEWESQPLPGRVGN